MTTDGVVLVRFRKEMFAAFDKQLSEKREDGTKKIVEKSWFNKGNKLMITGFRREDQFIPTRKLQVILCMKSRKLIKMVQ